MKDTFSATACCIYIRYPHKRNKKLRQERVTFAFKSRMKNGKHDRGMTKTSRDDVQRKVDYINFIAR